MRVTTNRLRRLSGRDSTMATRSPTRAAFSSSCAMKVAVRRWIVPALALWYWIETGRRYWRVRGTNDPALRKRSAAYTRVLLSQLLVAVALFGS